ncbi:MAG TPA: 50S ribosomal protein L9 [Polyangiaceae bacterium]|jgi:large subunit ribosomal protein L9|nr:50S ribosomal protein L9 [Polyangiaceae bacterium]
MAVAIQVVLQREVHNLGESGDVVKVRPGYARNFLYPRSLALPATAGNLARVEEFRRLARARTEAARKEAQATADQLSAVSVKITRAVGEENKMYGSVTSKDIESAYAEKGIKVDRKLMELPEPIRTLGLTEVKIRLYGDITATLRVEVVKQT